MVVAVSKTRPISSIQARLLEGFSHFGENRAPELSEKASVGLPVTWHFIGRIQTNKLKDIVSAADWIHSVDALKQLILIEKYAAEQHKIVKVLLQLNLTQETQKGGLEPKDLEPLIQACQNFNHIELKGLMAMGPSDADPIKTEACFKQAQVIFLQTQKSHPEMTELSMGMSHDYDLAYRYGSTCFRLGTVLFT
jgi:pyridoxal phosphate enzyme (YggS family)